MRRIFLLLSAAVIATTALAQRLTEQQAKERAESNPFCIGLLFYRVDEATKTASVVKAPPQYDYMSQYSVSEPVVIPDSVSYGGKNYVVTAVGDSAMMNFENVAEVQLPSTIKTIGGYAFSSAGINKINLPEGLTVIGDYAFFGTQLTDVVLPERLDSLGSNAFGFSNVSSIAIPSSVRHFGNSIFSFSRLAEVTLPENMEEIPYRLFADCLKLKTITLPQSVRRIG